MRWDLENIPFHPLDDFVEFRLFFVCVVARREEVGRSRRRREAATLLNDFLERYVVHVLVRRDSALAKEQCGAINEQSPG